MGIEDKHCLRCLKCCIIPLTGKLCKHAIRLKNGKGLCRIYKTRLGKIIDKQVIDGKIFITKCILRKDSKQEYEGCPWNDNYKE